MMPTSNFPVRRFWHHHYHSILIILALITALIWSLFLTQPHKLTDNVYALKLVGGCYVDYHAPIQSVGLACPGVDYIRPWPMAQPWPDATDWPQGPGWYAWEPARCGGFLRRNCEN